MDPYSGDSPQKNALAAFSLFVFLRDPPGNQLHRAGDLALAVEKGFDRLNYDFDLRLGALLRQPLRYLDYRQALTRPVA